MFNKKHEHLKYNNLISDIKIKAKNKILWNKHIKHMILHEFISHLDLANLSSDHQVMNNNG